MNAAIYVLCVAAVLTVVAPAAATPVRQSLDNGHATVLFPAGPPERVVIPPAAAAAYAARARARGIAPDIVASAAAAESFDERADGQFFMASAMRRPAAASATGSTCAARPRPRVQRTCSLLTGPGDVHGAEITTRTDAGLVTISRYLVRGDREYSASYSHAADALRRRAGWPAPSEAAGLAFVRSLKLTP